MKIKLGLGKIDMRDVAEFCGGELYDYTNKNECFDKLDSKTLATDVKEYLGA